MKNNSGQETRAGTGLRAFCFRKLTDQPQRIASAGTTFFLRETAIFRKM